MNKPSFEELVKGTILEKILSMAQNDDLSEPAGLNLDECDPQKIVGELTQLEKACFIFMHEAANRDGIILAGLMQEMITSLVRGRLGNEYVIGISKGWKLFRVDSGRENCNCPICRAKRGEGMVGIKISFGSESEADEKTELFERLFKKANSN